MSDNLPLSEKSEGLQADFSAHKKGQGTFFHYRCVDILQERIQANHSLQDVSLHAHFLLKRPKKESAYFPDIQRAYDFLEMACVAKKLELFIGKLPQESAKVPFSPRQDFAQGPRFNRVECFGLFEELKKKMAHDYPDFMDNPAKLPLAMLPQEILDIFVSPQKNLATRVFSKS